MHEIECPVPNADFDCPYCIVDGIYQLEHPEWDCDDYVLAIGEKE